MNQQAEFDVAVLGGGLAGLSLCRQLLMKHPELRIAVLEKRTYPVPESAHKVGESTVEIGAHYFGEQLRLKKHLTDSQLPKFGLRFFFKNPHQTLSEGTEIGGSTFFSAPSYQVDRGRLENFLAKSIAEAGAVVINGCRIRSVQLASTDGDSDVANHQVHYEQGGAPLSVVCRWVVDASGRAGILKRKLKLEEQLNHDINAAWFRVAASIQVDRWCDDRPWRMLTGKSPRRWLSTNHLMGEGYWVWLIPLATGSTSIGIVADPRIHPLRSINSLEKALAWLEKHEPECGLSVRRHREDVQDFLAIRNMSLGTRQVFSADRWALTGEAGAFLDPFYSPGSDFIAIGNTMIGKLIEEDLCGRSIDRLAPTLQSVFLTLFHNNLLTYRDQYALFGNPKIMAVKFVWDYAVYWGFPALLYFNEKLTDVGFIQSLGKEIEEIREMNLKMQQFFREWHASASAEETAAAFVDQSQIDLMTRMNAELLDSLDDVALKARFRQNVATLRDLMNEVTARVRLSQPSHATESEQVATTAPQLDRVFEVLNM